MMNHNTYWLYIPDHSYMILIIGTSGSGKTDVLLNLIKYQNWCLTKLNKTPKTRYWQNLLMHQNPFKSKYQLLINQREKVGINELKNQKAFSQINRWFLWKFTRL